MSGRTTYIFDGRRYSHQNCAAELQQRGRVHNFIDETQETMEMLWVYAGPKPERIVVDERCATMEGDPWQ